TILVYVLFHSNLVASLASMGPNIQLLLLLGTITAAFKYKFISTKKNWADAHSYCVTKYTDLAPINDESDIKLLQEQLNKNTSTAHVWMGLRFLAKEWMWGGKPECPVGNRDLHNHIPWPVLPLATL
uniref:C-type lectin domain-containing protein n=1 Tax=Periophthalmus magnuspinnatus TaxID=409849 RepID=A0A3B4ACG0_9GOBI